MKWSKSDGGIALLLMAAGFITRLPFRSAYLYHWDSVNFALSLTQYDVRIHQPHPPGYFFYSALGTALNQLVNDPNASLVLISLFSGVLGILAVWWLGRLMFDRATGLVAALLVLSSPTHWFHSEIALSYTLEFLLVTVFAGLVYLQLSGKTRWWWLAALLLAFMGGIRQNDLVFMLPLWFASLIPLNNRQRFGSLLLLGLGSLTWLIPMIQLSGGLDGYMAALASESQGIAEDSSLFSISQLLLNGGRMLIYMAYGLMLGALLLLWGAWHVIRQRNWRLSDRRLWTLGLWILPSLGFYVLIHLRQPGHIFTFLPAVILLVAWALTTLSRQIGEAERSPRIIAALTGSIVVFSVAFFLVVPPSLFGSDQLPLQTPSRNSIQTRDQFLAEHVAYMQANFDPDTTLTVVDGLDFRHPDFYLPDFLTISGEMISDEDMQVLPEEYDTLVLFNDRTQPAWLLSNEAFQTVPLAHGALYYITWEAGEQVAFNASTFEISGQEAAVTQRAG